MKNVKSVLALFMVIIIAVCSTACQSAEEIAESERLVSESVSESERIISESISESVSVSESISVSESVIFEENLKREENTEFSKWFNITIEPLESGSGFLFSIKPTAYGNDKINEIATANGTFIVGTSLNCNLYFGDTEYSYTDGFLRRAIGTDGDITNIYGFEFGNIDTKDYDSLTVTLAVDDGDDIILTHYRSVE